MSGELTAQVSVFVYSFFLRVLPQPQTILVPVTDLGLLEQL